MKLPAFPSNLPIWFFIFLTLSLWGDDFENANEQLLLKNKASLEELSSTRKKIQEEKIPLATQLSALERTLADKRRSLDRLQRLRDNKSVNLTALKSEVQGRKNEVQFLSTLGSDYLANFEARLHVVEIDRNQEELSNLKQTLDGTSSEKEKMIARMKLLKLSVSRIKELLGGTQFEGMALDGNGKVQQGSFMLSGPLAYFSQKSGDLAGLIESGRDLKPRIFELPEPQSSTVRTFFSSKPGTVKALPVDSTLGDALKIAAAEETTWEHIKKGGTWAYPIVLAAGLSFIIALLKWSRLGGIKVPPISVVNGILTKMESGDQEAALKQANSLKGPFQTMFAVAVKRSGEGKKLVDEVMYEELLDAQIKLDSYLPIIQVIAATAPLMGLLGTVTGMIKTFKQITLFGTGDAKSLSEGISEALITTELGLVAAIPSLILYAVLSRKSKAILSEMERLSSHFLNEFPKKSKLDSGSPKPDDSNDSSSEASLQPA
jgi:biopolymer transport protein ExbB